MQSYDFDRIVERRGTGAVKYDALQPHFGRTDLDLSWERLDKAEVLRKYL